MHSSEEPAQGFCLEAATIAAAWDARAEELADWALLRFFVRRDRFGAYYTDEVGTQKVARPKEATPGAVNRALLVRHYRATDTRGVIGPYYLATEPDCRGRVASADIDAHGANDDPERNRRYAEHLYFKLAKSGFRPLLATWGGGSFHLHTLFERDIPGDGLHAFGRWLVSDASEFGFPEPVECFPKQPSVPAGKFGNWLRLVGRHHTRDVWAQVYDGERWLEGEEAVAHLLSLTGDSPALIPADAFSAEDDNKVNDEDDAPAKKGAAGVSSKTNAKVGGGGAADDRDVFDEYNRGATLDLVVKMLEARGHRVTRKTAERAEFVRAGKKAGESFNVQVRDGCPITFNFSSKAALPERKGLNPAQLRCFLDHGDTSTASMAKLAETLKKELGWPEDPKPTMSGKHRPGPQRSPDEPPTGTQIILAHFRETYSPSYRRGFVVVKTDGEEIQMHTACAVADSDLIARLAGATDAPRYVSKPGQPGEVNHSRLPGFFKTWAKIAWGDLLKQLPDEDAADLKVLDCARDEFRRLVREALLSEIVLGDVIGNSTVTQVERRSLIDWCQKFAKLGPWRSIRSKMCWCCAVEKPGGEIQLKVSIRHELFSQVSADRRLRDMGSSKFTRRAAAYGVGTSTRADRVHGKAAVVLNDDFVNDLIDSMPADDTGEVAAA